jgi:hypothetical protein
MTQCHILNDPSSKRVYEVCSTGMTVADFDADRAEAGVLRGGMSRLFSLLAILQDAPHVRTATIEIQLAFASESRQVVR